MATYRSVFGLDDCAISNARETMRRYGNQSSASVLFMLNDLVASRRPGRGDTGFMLALGPGFSQSAVSQALAKREALILGELTNRVESHKARMTAELEQVSRRAWEQFEESCRDTKTKGFGDPRYLQVILKAKEQVAKLWGLTREQPPGAEQTVDWDDFTFDEIDRRIAAIKKWNDKRRLAAAKSTQGEGGNGC